MKRVLIPLIDGFEEIEAITCIDLLRRAGIQVVTAGIGKQEATGSHEVQLKTDAIFDRVKDDEYDLILLPGGPGTKKLKDVADLQHRLRRQIEEGKPVAAICAAPTILAAAGLLDGKRAACFPSVEEEVQAGGATVEHEEVVRDGLLITSRGAGTAMPFALAVVERLAGASAAKDLAKAIIFQADK